MAIDQTVEATRLDVGGRRVAVWRFGCVGGWPLVWNHGGLICGRDAKVMEAAARKCGADIFSIDRPGIGRSDFWSMSSIAEWPLTVARVADVLQMGKFAVAGWSGGGPYALACAAVMPERVRAVATVAGMAPLETVSHVFELGLWADRLLIPTARWWPRSAATLMWLAWRLPDRYLAWEARHGAVGSRDRAAPEAAIASLVAAVRESTSGGVRGMVDEYRRYYGSWGFDLEDVRQSVTIWQGAQDTWLPLKHARRLASALPNSTLRVVPSTGHLIPVVIADEILDDLAP
jgi:pimeloyl-ACP methyl ester carboxylesterase